MYFSYIYWNIFNTPIRCSGFDKVIFLRFRNKEKALYYIWHSLSFTLWLICFAAAERAVSQPWSRTASEALVQRQLRQRVPRGEAGWTAVIPTGIIITQTYHEQVCVVIKRNETLTLVGFEVLHVFACICSSVILSNSFCVWLTGSVRLTAWRKPGWVHFFTKISQSSHIWISGGMLTLGPGFRLSVRLWRRITIIFRGNSWKIRERWTFWGKHWKRRRTTSTSWWRKPGKHLLFA